jgi:hypothetical protein
MGQLRLQTVLLVADGWNVSPTEEASPYPLTEDTLVEYLEPEAFEYIYNEILKLNPVWGGSEGESTSAA